jgi:hypothetical protein
VFNVIGPNSRVGDQVAYDAEGGVVEMATDVVLESDGWRVLWSRAAESGLEITDQVRHEAALALSEARIRLDPHDPSGVQVQPKRRRLLATRRRRQGDNRG